MTPQEIYFDNNATTMVLPEVAEAMVRVLREGFGNAASAHSVGGRARGHLRRARERVAALIGVEPEQILFTSGGTEANNMALGAVLTLGQERDQVLTTSIEHSSILSMCDYLEGHGIQVEPLPVDRSGRIEPERVMAALTERTALVSVQWVNNETGVIQPVEDIARLCHEAGVRFHTDAAQAVGKLSLDIGALPIDYLTLTAHKFHGPQGVGAVFAAQGRSLMPRMYGGPQESGLRAGTENLPGIVGLGEAARLRHERLGEIEKKLGMLRDRLESMVLDRLSGVDINGGSGPRVSNTTNLRFHGVDGEAFTARLDQVGIQCSQSSACTNQRPEPSYVLTCPCGEPG